MTPLTGTPASIVPLIVLAAQAGAPKEVTIAEPLVEGVGAHDLGHPVGVHPNCILQESTALSTPSPSISGSSASTMPSPSVSS